MQFMDVDVRRENKIQHEQRSTTNTVHTKNKIKNFFFFFFFLIFLISFDPVYSSALITSPSDIIGCVYVCVSLSLFLFMYLSLLIIIRFNFEFKELSILAQQFDVTQ